MKTLINFIAALMLLNVAFSINLLAQPTQAWVASYSTTGTNNEYGSKVVTDASGNVYVAGASYSGVNGDYLVIKYNGSGAQLWTATYDGTGSGTDEATSIALDASGNVYVTGYSDGGASGNDYITIKYNSTGVQQWVAAFNGIGNAYDYAAALTVDASGNIYVSGYSDDGTFNYDYATVKYNNAGVQQWVATFNGPGNGADNVYALTIDGSGNIYVSGYSDGGASGFDYATVKYNNAGVQQWVATYNGTGNGQDVAHALAVDASGNVYVTGYALGVASGYDYATVKYSNAGVQQWVAAYNGTGNDQDVAKALAIDASGNVFVTGSSYDGISENYSTLKYNTAGVQQWVAIYNVAGNGDDVADAIAVDASGNVLVTGFSYGGVSDFDYATVKYNSTGAQQWVAIYNGSGNGYEEAVALAVDASGNVYVTGYSETGGTQGDNAVTIKYSEAGTISTGAVTTPLCAGAAVSVPYTATGTFNAGNIFTAELSDATGSFAAPVGIGTLPSTGSGAISAMIPGGTPAGTGYRIRVVSSNPVTIGSNNGSNITIRFSLSGTYTIGAGGNYANLTAVANALNSTSSLAGHCIFEFTPTYTPAAEVYPVTFNPTQSCDGNSYNVIIRPQTGAGPIIMTAPLFSTDIILLNGIDRISFDGRPGGSGTMGVWTLKHSGGATSGFQFANDASDNSLSYLRIECRGGANILFTAPIISGATGNDNNVIQNCFLTSLNSSIVAGQQPADGIRSVANATPQNDANSIIDNEITNFTAAGINLFQAGNAWTITGNHIYNSYTSALGGLFGIKLISNGSGHIVSGNYIGGTAPFAGGTPWTGSSIGLTGIEFNASLTSLSTISNNVINNINLPSTNGVFAGINIGVAGSGGFVTCSGNTIGNANTPNSIVTNSTNPSYGIHCTPTANTTISFLNNTVANITHTNTTTTTQLFGIKCDNIPTYIVTGNLVKNLSSASTRSNDIETALPQNFALIGLYVRGGTSTTQIISNNTISGLGLTTTSATNPIVCGIGFENATGTVSGNLIYDLTNTATNTTVYPAISGITSKLFAYNRTISNNMIALSNGSNTNGVKIYGLSDEITTGGTVFYNYYYNSVVISGTTSNAARSSAYIRFAGANGAGTTINFKNNIFYNNRTGGTGKHYAMINTSGSATGWPVTSSNYNNLYTSNPNTLGAWPLASDKTFATWKSTSGGDANSKNVITSFFNIFSDLHLNNYTNGALSNSGNPAGGITIDYDNQTGNRTTTPDIGADEFNYAPPSCNTSYTKAYCAGTATGTATISPGNGGPPYSYLWSNSQSTFTSTGLLQATYTVTVTDTTLFAICTSALTVLDSTDVVAPAIACPATSTVICAADTTPVHTGIPAAIDDCSPPISYSHADVISSQTFPGNFVIIRTWTVTDNAGNISSCMQTINVNDNTAPVANVTLLPTVSGQCSATVTAPAATDNCAGTIAGTTTDATSYSAQGNYTITWTYDDGNGNASTQTQNVIVNDNTPPVANATLLPTVSGQCSATVTAPTATDNCAGTITGTTADATSFSTQGNYTITWTYNDGNGNSSTQTQSVIVNDNIAPVANVTLLPTISGQCSATVTAPTATDNCTGTITGTTTDATSYLAQGNYIITWAYNDGNGNTSTQTQNVIVDDVTAPVANVTLLPTVSGQCSATVAAPTATDNCEGTITGTTTDATSYLAQGNYIITWAYNDGNGNTSTQTQNVIVDDVTAPVAIVTLLPTVSGQCSATVTAPTATDNCTGTITGTTTDATSYSAQGNYIITWTYDDGNGNASTQTQSVFVDDNINPVISGCPTNVVTNPNVGDCNKIVSWTEPTATDNCAIQSFISNYNSGQVFPLGTTTVTYTAIDIHGNIATCNFTVTINANSEICGNSIDDDCDGLVDEGCGSGCNLTVNAGNDESTFFGYSGDQTVTRTATVSGGTAPFTYSWTLGRSLKCNSITSAGDEIFSGGNCTNTTCPVTGNLTGIATCSGSATVTVRLMDTTNVCVTVTDANGCTASDCFLVMAQDARCFAGNNNNAKVKVCRHTGNPTNPWVQICIAENAVAAHLANNSGDYIGTCGSRFANGTYSGSIGMFLYPNPAQNQVTVEFDSPVDGAYQVSLFDITGRIVSYNNGSALEGGNKLEIPINGIAPGVYNIRLTVGDESISVRLIITE